MGRSGYGAGFRVRAVQLAEEIGYRRAESILGVSARAINTWKRWPLNGEPVKKEVSPELKAALLEADQAKKELKQLKKENEELKIANLILKEVASVFSKDLPNSNLGRSLSSKSKK
jgi:transposase-like protein